MSLFELFEKRCVSCPSQTPQCNCDPNTQSCQIIAQSCGGCSFAQCIDKPTKQSSGGVSKGALAGGIVGIILFLAIAVSLFLWNRRRLQRQRAMLNLDQKPDVPAPAELVLNRPDPNEKPLSPIPFSSTGFLQQQQFQEQQKIPPVESVRVYNNNNSTSSSTINLDPFSQQDARHQSVPGNGVRNANHRISETSNPFTDHQSIITASDSMQSDDVIPIALVPHTSNVNMGASAAGGAAGNAHSPRSSTLQSTSTGSSNSAPTRPARAPDLDIRLNSTQADSKLYDLEHVNVSQDSFRPPQMPFQSRGDGASDRTSWYTQASGTSAFSEAPQIAFVKPLTMRGAPVVRAAMVKAPGSPNASTLSTTSKQQAMKSRTSKASARSPLAQSGFTAETSSETDVDEHGQEIEMPLLPGAGNPFGDEQYPHSSNLTVNLHSPMSGGSPSEAALPTGTSRDGGFTNVYDYIGNNYTGRPLSDATQAGSLISPGDVNIASATRVQVVGPSPLRGIGIEVGSKTNRLTHGHLVPSPSASPQSMSPASTGSIPSMPGFVRSPAASSTASNALQEQQAHALAVARAKASAISNNGISRDSTMSGMSDVSLDPPSRISYGGSYRSSTASAGGDSLLESFTFVPPSPIASRPPRSPLSQKSPAAGSPLAGSSMQDQQQRAREVLLQQQQQLRERERLEKERLEREADMELDGRSDVMSRRTQALSTISHASGTSALDGYAFHIESPLMPHRHGGASGSISSHSAFSPANVDANGGDGVVTPTMPGTPTGTSTPIATSPTATVGRKSVRNRQRASLDTLALTQDLSAFPLNFSR